MAQAEDAWRLYLNGEEVATAKGQQAHLERPRTKWSIGGGVVACVAEVRVWRSGRTQQDIARDMSRPLVGDEVGLAAYDMM